MPYLFPRTGRGGDDPRRRESELVSMGVSTDPMADALTGLRNAGYARKDKVDLPASKLLEQLLILLKAEGFIEQFKKMEEKPQGRIRVYLRYLDGKAPAITHVKRVSRPGMRVYLGRAALRPVRGGLGLAVVSTSKGLLTDVQARQAGVGGEVLCQIW